MNRRGTKEKEWGKLSFSFIVLMCQFQKAQKEIQRPVKQVEAFILTSSNNMILPGDKKRYKSRKITKKDI